MPSGLAIDRERALNGTMPPYAQHVVVRTGRDDWGNRIEDEGESVEGTGMNFARSLKGLVGRGGRFFNVCMYVGWISMRICYWYRCHGSRGLMQARSSLKEPSS